MKAIVLCAGPGTRMRPLTNTTPKCMLPVGGKPLLHHTLERLAEAGVTDVAINLHHLPKAIVHDIKRGWQFDLRVTYSYERELLGTAGAIKRLAWWLDEEPFFVVYGDEWTTIDFARLWAEHVTYRPEAKVTAVVHWVDTCAGRNCVDLAMLYSVVTRVMPKHHWPDHGGWALSGIYVLDRLCAHIIPEPGAYDIETHMLPSMIDNQYLVQPYRVDPILAIDIGKPEGYARACALAGPSW